MRIGALVHFSYPFRAAGSETVLAELLRAAKDVGHDTQVWCTHKDAMHSWRGTEPDVDYDGTTVHRVRNSLVGAQKLRLWKPDVVVTHHQHALTAIKAAKQAGARSVFLTHNDYDLNKRPLLAKPDLVIHNSNHVADSLGRFGGNYKSLVMHPPLTPERHTVSSTGDHITLANLNAHKGAQLFYELAQLEPSRKFLGVVGGHGDQIIRRNLPNVEIIEHTPNMREVWARTRVVLMPSLYESYGLIAVEAGVNGIPTIAHPTTGLVENLGPDGLYADRDSVDEWRRILKDLDGPMEYAQASGSALRLAQAAMRDTRESLNQWLAWLDG